MVISITGNILYNRRLGSGIEQKCGQSPELLQVLEYTIKNYCETPCLSKIQTDKRENAARIGCIELIHLNLPHFKRISMYLESL